MFNNVSSGKNQKHPTLYVCQSIAIHKHLCQGGGMDLGNLTLILRHGTTSRTYLTKGWQEDLGKQHHFALAMLFSGCTQSLNTLVWGGNH